MTKLEQIEELERKLEAENSAKEELEEAANILHYTDRGYFCYSINILQEKIGEIDDLIEEIEDELDDLKNEEDEED